MNRRALMSGAGVAVLLGAAFVAGPATAQDGSDTVHLVHGVPGQTVDVCVDGAKVQDDLAPGTRDAEGMSVALGDHTVVVAAEDSGADCTGGTAEYLNETVTLDTPDLDLDLVAHLNEAGDDWTLTAFTNDTSATSRGDGRIVVRHAAATGGLDARLDGTQFGDTLMNGDEAATSATARAHELSIVSDSSMTPFVANETIDVTAGTEYLRYVVGSEADASAEVLTFDTQVGETAVTTGRIAGEDRFETSVEISKQTFPDGAPVVYLARHDAFPDALAGKSLTDGPILIVPRCTQDLNDYPSITAELKRLNPDRVVALGGADAVCDTVLEQAAQAAAG